jgi:hypothetical protein
VAATTFSLRYLLVFAAVAAGSLSAGRAEAQYDAGDDDARFVSFAARMSVVVPGEITLSARCTGDDCPDDDEEEEDTDRTSSFNLGGELLFRLSEVMRLGFGVDAQLTKYEVDEDPDEGEDIGRFIRLPAIGEARIGLTDSLALPLRAFVGPAIFVPDGPFEDALEANEEGCDAAPNCSSDGTLGVGLTVGGGIGLLFDLGPVSLRGDLLVGFDWARMQTLDVDDATLKFNLSSLMIAPSFAVEI